MTVLEDDRSALALQALAEVTDPASVGELVEVGETVSGVRDLVFACRLPGYVGWRWTVSTAQVGDAAPTVLEVELLPGEGALVAPPWVPWAERLAEYRRTHPDEPDADVDAADLDEDEDLDEDDLDEDDELDDDEVDADALELDGVDFEDVPEDGETDLDEDEDEGGEDRGDGEDEPAVEGEPAAEEEPPAEGEDGAEAADPDARPEGSRRRRGRSAGRAHRD